jgi:hypothetical protein
MSDFREGVGNALGQLACSSSRAYRTLTQDVPLANALIGGAIPQLGSYLMERLFCNKDPISDPFTPGNCDYGYNVTVRIRISGSPTPGDNRDLSIFWQKWGPIGTATYRRVEEGEIGGRQLLFIDATDRGFVADGQPQAYGKREIAGPISFHALATCVILGITATPIDPNADLNCGGNPPVPPYQPEDHTYPININFDIDSVSYNLPFTAVVGLFYVDADLNLKMPVTFDIDPTFNANLTFAPKFTATLNLTTGNTEINWFEGDGGPPPNQLPPSSDSPPITRPDNQPPSPPDGIDSPPSDPDDVEAGRILIAVLVTVTQAAPNRVTKIFQDGNPDIYAPNLGFVSFAYRTSGGAVGWTNDIPVKNLRAYIPAPVQTGAVEVRGTPGPGVTWALTPVYRQQTLLAGGA